MRKKITVVGRKKKRKRPLHDSNHFFFLSADEIQQVSRMREKAKSLYSVDLIEEKIGCINPRVKIRVRSTSCETEDLLTCVFVFGHWAFYNVEKQIKKSAKIAALFYLYETYNPNFEEKYIARKIVQVTFG